MGWAICHIKTCGSLNTTTPFMLTIACPITYIDPHTLLRTDIWARTIAFSSNLLSTTSVSVLLGDLVTGIATATFGGHLTCQLESWRRCPDEEWTYGSQSRIPDGSERDLDHWTWSSLPALGGSGFVVNMRNGYVVGARLAPPPLGPRDFHADRQEGASNVTFVDDPVIDPYLLSIANHAAGHTSDEDDASSSSTSDSSVKRKHSRRDYRVSSMRAYRYLRERSRYETSRGFRKSSRRSPSLPKTPPRSSKDEKPRDEHSRSSKDKR